MELKWEPAEQNVTVNGALMTNAFFLNAIRTGSNAWSLRTQAAQEEVSSKAGWCFDRFGRTETKLRDGRVIFIAGEHEDGYDPDFHIYNDVVVKQRDGTFELYGYPLADFMPTDFHSATLLSDGLQIVIIGALSYIALRTVGRTPTFILDTNSMKVQRRVCSGSCPGWISKHTAHLDGTADGVIIEGGVIWDGVELIPNLNTFRLDIPTWTWTKLTDHDDWMIFRLTSRGWYSTSVEVMSKFGFEKVEQDDDDDDDDVNDCPVAQFKGQFEGVLWHIMDWGRYCNVILQGICDAKEAFKRLDDLVEQLCLSDSSKTDRGPLWTWKPILYPKWSPESHPFFPLPFRCAVRTFLLWNIRAGRVFPRDVAYKIIADLSMELRSWK